MVSLKLEGFPVVKKPMRQWVLKITEYAERLLTDLDDLDWPEPLKEMQRIGLVKAKALRLSLQSQTKMKSSPYLQQDQTLFSVPRLWSLRRTSIG